MTDPTYIPDPALVRTLTAKVIDGAIEELRDAGAMDISEIGADELDGLSDDEQDATIQAVRDTLRDVSVGYVLPGQADTLLHAAACTLYAAGQIDQAAAVQYAADHQADPDEPETARLTADVVLFGHHITDGPDGDLYVLVIDRGWDPFKGRPALPGGHIEPDEDPIDAAYRELIEETGISIGPCLKPVGVYATPGRDPRGRYATWAYTARLARLPEPTAGDDAAGARWVLVDELLGGGDLAFDHATIIRAALRVVA